MRIVLIVPTYNERENIGPFLDRLLVLTKKEKDEYKILVVDDNSPDGTGEIVKNYSKNQKNIVLLSGSRKGLGVAMLRAYRFSIKKLKPDVLVSTEADFAYEPRHIPFMVEKIKEGADVVIGSRHVGRGKAEGWTLSRRLNHWFANKFFATWVAGVKEVYDHNGALRAIRVKGVLDKLNLNSLKVSGFGFFNYSLFKLTLITKKFYEFPVTYKFRSRGESKVSFNPKYISFYLHDVFEYIGFAFKIRMEKFTMNKA